MIPETLLVMSHDAFRAGFDDARLARLRELAALADPAHATGFDSPAVRNRLADVEVLVTGWGTPPIDADVLAAAPQLRAVLHTAGSVKDLVGDAAWERGLLVTTAAEANAVPVAEYALAAILFAGKRVLASAHAFAAGRGRGGLPAGSGSNYQRTVGVVGYSRIGRRVVDLLWPFDFDVLVADPYTDAVSVTAAGARLVDLDELLAGSEIVSIHAPALPTTRHLIGRERLALLRDGATLINTARGSIVDTAALEAECVSGRLSAVLDVTDPEPLPPGSPLWELPNVLLTPHVAGAQNSEIHRLADAALDELERYANGQPPRHAVTPGDLDRIA